jgi:hypothetical protein
MWEIAGNSRKDFKKEGRKSRKADKSQERKGKYYFFISPLFNQVGNLRTSSHLQLRPDQDKAKQFDTYNKKRPCW